MTKEKKVKDTKTKQYIKIDYARRQNKLSITYRDLKDNTKKQKIISNPMIEYYITKQDQKIQKYQKDIEIEKVDRFQVPFREIFEHMNETLGDSDFTGYYRDIEKSGNWSKLRDLHNVNPNVFASDIDIVDYYIRKFINEEHDGNATYLSKAFFDIEVDTYYSQFKGFPVESIAPCPVNFISYFYQPENKLTLFCYDNEKNEAIKVYRKKYEDNTLKLKKNILKYLEKHELKLPDLKISFKFFSSEFKLISAFFKTVNFDKPDTVSA